MRTIKLGSNCPRCWGKTNEYGEGDSDRYCRRCSNERKRYRDLVRDTFPEVGYGRHESAYDALIPELCELRGEPLPWGFDPATGWAKHKPGHVEYEAYGVI